MVAERPYSLAVLVTGSRHWTEQEPVRAMLLGLGPDVVVHGDALGADQIASLLCHGLQLSQLPMRARWKLYGKSAGPRRNREMLQVLSALKACGWETRIDAFPMPDSVGTYHMMDLARRQGFAVYNHGHQRGSAVTEGTAGLPGLDQ